MATRGARYSTESSINGGPQLARRTTEKEVIAAARRVSNLASSAPFTASRFRTAQLGVSGTKPVSLHLSLSLSLLFSLPNGSVFSSLFLTNKFFSRTVWLGSREQQL